MVHKQLSASANIGYSLVLSITSSFFPLLLIVCFRLGGQAQFCTELVAKHAFLLLNLLVYMCFQVALCTSHYFDFLYLFSVHRMHHHSNFIHWFQA